MGAVDVSQCIHLSKSHWQSSIWPDDDPARADPATQADMLKSISPIQQLDKITTPLFVLHGANDTNVPVIEAEQIVSTMKARGIPVKYTLFPDEGHGWRKTANRVRSTTEIVDFLREHLTLGTPIASGAPLVSEGLMPEAK